MVKFKLNPISACIALGTLLLLSGCGPGLNLEKTTPADLIPSPELPPMWYPFHPPPEAGAPFDIYPLSAKDYVNKMPIQDKESRCDVLVQKLEVLTNGPVQGGLRFNEVHRHTESGADDDYNFPQTTNNNMELGPVQAGNLYLYYKYEGTIVFAGNLKNAFYGQMKSDQLSLEKPEDNTVVFHPAMPTNDYIGMPWRTKRAEAQSFKAYKGEFPIVTADNTTVNFIQCPGGPAGIMGIGRENKKQYFIVYAGACNRITDLKVYRVSFPAGQPPAMVEIPPADLVKEVHYSFEEIR